MRKLLRCGNEQVTRLLDRLGCPKGNRDRYSGRCRHGHLKNKKKYKFVQGGDGRKVINAKKKINSHLTSGRRKGHEENKFGYFGFDSKNLKIGWL